LGRPIECASGGRGVVINGGPWAAGRPADSWGNQKAVKGGQARDLTSQNLSGDGRRKRRIRPPTVLWSLASEGVRGRDAVGDIYYKAVRRDGLM